MATTLAGLRLDENFDLVVDDSGDIDATSGVDELEKDLSGAVSAIIQDRVLGDVLTKNDIVELESLLQSRIEFDARVDAVDSISVERSTIRNSISVTIIIDSIYGRVELNR